MAWFVDFVGLNSLVSSSVDTTPNTIESGRQEFQPGPARSVGISDADVTVGINIHRNGPYGYPTWKQIRAGENPISRYHRSNSDLTYVKKPGDRVDISFETQGGLRVNIPGGLRLRRSDIINREEPAVCQRTYPLVLKMKYKVQEGNLLRTKHGTEKTSVGLHLEYFANKSTNDDLNAPIPNLDHPTATPYSAFVGQYLNGAFETTQYPYDTWESLTYRETVWPKARNQFRLEVKNRPEFDSFYRYNRADRNQPPTQTPLTTSFGYEAGHVNFGQSTWPMDASMNFLTDTTVTISRAFYNIAVTPRARATGAGTDKSGILQNNYSQLLIDNPMTSSFGTGNAIKNSIDVYLTPAPYYSRRQTLTYTSSLGNPTGMAIPETASVGNVVFGSGQAMWETPHQSGKPPFLDSYDEWVYNLRLKAKNYSLIPEYRMSNHITDLIDNVPVEDLTAIYEITGGTAGQSNSSHSGFFKVYSHTDFLKMFDKIEADHEGFGNFDGTIFEDSTQDLRQKLTLRCSVIKKFLPYEGFYPQQRTVQLANQFYNSYIDNIKVSHVDPNIIPGDDLNNYPFQMLMNPMFAPGVLYNTIKSGVACDYPIITSTGSAAGPDYIIRDTDSSSKENYYINNDFDKRVPFDSLIEPAKYLAGFEIVGNEAHPSGTFSGSVYWDGQTSDELYPLMADNFLAEVPEFFMDQPNFTRITSKTSDDPSVGNVEGGKIYGMRIKMYRTMNQARTQVTASTGISYLPPQDIVKDDLRETLTMYSRPTAFGPPCWGRNVFNFGAFSEDHYSLWEEPGRGIRLDETYELNNGTNGSGIFWKDSSTGYNFPFTPPYYHGEAWIDLYYTASATGKKSLNDIVNNLHVTMSRFDYQHYAMTNASNTSVRGDGALLSSNGPQGFKTNSINRNAMQLSASVDWNVIASTSGEFRRVAINPDGTQNITVVNDENVGNRWVIQTKFETPILNFKNISVANGTLTLPAFATESVPRGMWHQYGSIPSANEGVFLEVGDIPFNWTRRDTVGAGVESLANICGFDQQPRKLGKLKQSKTVYEAVIAVPFYIIGDKKSYIKLDRTNVEQYLRGNETSVGFSSNIEEQIEKMKKYVLPPEFDFLRNEAIDPFAMYIFEFSHEFSRKDLADMWQGVLPDGAQEVDKTNLQNSLRRGAPHRTEKEFEILESVVSHRLNLSEMLGGGTGAGIGQPEDHSLHQTVPPSDSKLALQWMVFKVKQRATTNYFSKILAKRPIYTPDDGGSIPGNSTSATKPEQTIFDMADVDMDRNEIARLSRKGIHYNWPYDFFSIIEFAKLDASVAFEFDESMIPPVSVTQPTPDQMEGLMGGFQAGYTAPEAAPAPGGYDAFSQFGATQEETPQPQEEDEDTTYLESMPIKEIEERIWEYYERRYDYHRNTKNRSNARSHVSALAETYIFGYSDFGWTVTMVKELIERMVD